MKYCVKKIIDMDRLRDLKIETILRDMIDEIRCNFSYSDSYKLYFAFPREFFDACSMNVDLSMSTNDFEYCRDGKIMGIDFIFDNTLYYAFRRECSICIYGEYLGKNPCPQLTHTDIFPIKADIRKNKIEIKKVIFNDPATIVYWKDGSKTIVKCDGENFDKEKGLAMAISKKVLGTNKTHSNYNDIFRKWCEED